MSKTDLSKDWRRPENRREAFQRFYSFHLKYGTHPGCVYFWLPDIADAYELDADQRAWLVWLNGNTQNPITSLLLLEAAPSHRQAEAAVEFWNTHFKALEWDTDRRHQKSRFADATRRWVELVGDHPARGWERAGRSGWEATWRYSLSQPYMGRLSAWSMMEYARILLGAQVPDIGSLMLTDAKGSQSHRNGLAFLAGHDSVYWGPEAAKDIDLVMELDELGTSLMDEARERNPDSSDVLLLTFESALCTYKSWHKPNRRYPNVYADMAYLRLLRGERHFGRRFDLLWDSRAAHLPDYLRLEATLEDPGLVPEKQNHYRQTGRPIMMHREWPDLDNEFNRAVDAGAFGMREDASRWLI